MSDFKAYCSSSRCDSKGTSAFGVQKLVPRGTFVCPDCGNLITWRNSRKKLHTIRRGHTRKEQQQGMFD